MSNGKTHSSNSIGVAFGIPIGYTLGYFLYPNQLPSLIGGVLFGLLFSPDNDVDGGNIGYYYIRKTIGTDVIWKWWWYPYAKGIQHRSFISHFPVVSTFYRYVYILFPLSILLVKDDKSVSRLSLLLPAIVSQIISIPLIGILVLLYYFGLLDYVYPFILGNVFPDILHYLADKLS